MGRKFQRLVLGQKGFTLPEVLIGAAILAGVALGGAQLFTSQKKNQKNVELDQRLAAFHSQLARLLMTGSHCNATIKAAFPTRPTSFTADFELTSLYRCTTGCNDQNATADQSFDAYTTGAYNYTAASALVTKNNYIDGTRTWRVKKIDIKYPVTNTSRLVFEVAYEMNPDLSKRSVSKVISMNVRFGPRSSTDPTIEFKECVNSAESNVNNLQSDLCKTLNLAESATSDGRIAVWDSATQTCKLNTAVKNCPDGGGMAVDGSPLSNSPVSAFRCKDIVDSTTDPVRLRQNLTNHPIDPCASGEKPYMRYDSVNKEFFVECAP